MNKTLWTVGAVVLVGLIFWGGSATYTSIKESPPTWLIKLFTQTTPPPPLPIGDVAPLNVPDGFVATIFSRETPGARILVQDPKGTLVVSLTESGKVVALSNLDGDGTADRTVPILTGLNKPHGLAFHCPSTGNASADQDDCKFFVAETDAVKQYRYDADTYTATYEKTLLTIPGNGGHVTRTLLIAPDERLLVSVGSTCNVCDEASPLRAAVTAINLKTGATSLYATGLRNTVGLATNPINGEVWGVDNGRDLIGDDIPPDEVNVITEGKNYGWPICYGRNIHDTDFDTKQYFRDPCADSMPPKIELQAHSAPLGIAFLPEEGWPEQFRNDIVVTYHGSWNRSVPTGFKVVRFDYNGTYLGEAQDFITGFVQAGQGADYSIGRPVSLLALPGGVLYLSDDRAGAVYRISAIAQ